MWKHSYIRQNRRDSTTLLLLVVTLTYVAGDNMKQPPAEPPELNHLRHFSVGDKQSIDVVTEIAGQDYIKFGHLILEDASGNKVSSIDKNKRNPEDTVVEILHQWLQGKGREPVTWQTLVICLHDSGLNALADCINSVITSDSSLCNLAAMNKQQPILEYAKVLKDTYKARTATDPDHWLQISMPFINLTLTERDNTGKWLHDGRNDLSLAVIANSITDGSKVLMEGRPGVGKTTLLRHIAQQWAVGNFLQNFSLVIFLPLGRINSSRITNLENMLKYISPDQDTASVKRELGRTGGKGICLLMDALDEYTPQSPEGDYVYKLIKGDVTLPNAAMIVTSRGNYSIGEQHFTRNIVVFGFSEHQIEQYINAVTLYDAKLSKYLNDHTYIKNLSYLPLHLAMVSYLVNQSEEILLDLDTDTRIYHMLVNLTFRQRHSGKEDFDELHSQAFSVVSKASFDATQSSGHPMPVTASRVLHGKEQFSFLEMHDHLLWNQIIDSYSILSIKGQRKGYKIIYTFTFSHHTFQDFFAAYYLTTLPYKEQIEMMELSVPPFYPYLIWKFFFGLLRDRSSENSTKLFQKFSTTYRDDHVILTCAYELKQPAIADVLAQSLNHSIIIKRYALQHPSDCAAIGYAISLNPLQFKRLAIKYTVFHPKQWEECFLSICNKVPKINEVAHVTFDRLELSDRTASAAIKLLQHFPNLQQLELWDVLTNSSILTAATELEGLKHLRHLEISSFDIMTETIAALSGTLKSLDHLENLTLSGLRIDVVKQLIDENVDLSDLSRNPPLLQKLNLTRNEIGDDEIEALAELIKHLTSLQELDLSWNAIGDRGIEKLAEETKHLISLDLSNNKIGDEGAAKLAQSLKKLTSLRVLKLRSNAIGNDGSVALAEGMKHLTSLQELDLSNNTIGDLGAAKLAEETKHLSSLRRLDLDCNRISAEGHKSLLEAVKTGWSGLETLTVGSNTTYSNNDLVGIRSLNATYYDNVKESHSTEPVDVILVVLNYIMLGLLLPVKVILAVLYYVMSGLLYYVMLVLLWVVNVIQNVLHYVMSGLLYYVKLVLLWPVNVIQGVLNYVMLVLLWPVNFILSVPYYVTIGLSWSVHVILVVLYYVMFGLLVYVIVTEMLSVILCP